MRIYLIGFMGTGKSTLGQRAAAVFDVPFFDTDKVIEAQSGMSIPDIFKNQGEEFFRQLESDILRQTTFYPRSINATGGGLPCFEDNMNWMTHHGMTIYLQWPDDLIAKHLLQERNSRPLLAQLDDTDASVKIKDLLKIRKPFYEQSAMTIEMKGNEEQDFNLLERAINYIW